jgi:hypothetical protein
MSEEASAYRPRCKNLYCKSILVYGEAFESDPEYQMGLGEFWCLCTSQGHGPDEGEVNLEQCSRPDRECFKEY